jgi:hypothetical protein
MVVRGRVSAIKFSSYLPSFSVEMSLHQPLLFGHLKLTVRNETGF